MSGRKRARTGLATLLGEVEQLPGNKRELLQCANDDRHAAFQSLRQLLRTLVDLLNHTQAIFKLVDRVLKLLIENQPIRHDDDAVEYPYFFISVPRCQTVRQPTNRFALAAHPFPKDLVLLLQELGMLGQLPIRAGSDHSVQGADNLGYRGIVVTTKSGAGCLFPVSHFDPKQSCLEQVIKTAVYRPRTTRLTRYDVLHQFRSVEEAIRIGRG